MEAGAAVWLDAETSKDYVNFQTVAESVVELIVQAQGEPLSIGVSGDWGTGKTSLMRLTRAELARRDPGGHDDKTATYVFVDFNAWLYQGYDDARAALLEAIATKLAEVAAERKTGVDKTQDFLARVNWFRLGNLVGSSAVAMALGLPPLGLIGQGVALFKRGKKNLDSSVIEEGQELVGDAIEAGQGLLKDADDDETPRQKIEALRSSFEDALAELEVTLVVLIDDLDRCLPETAVSTLEAIRLFLFLKGTAFVIAADDAMIRHAVKRHFGHSEDELVTNYFDKLIQIPIRVPKLGTQEVRSYMFMLYVESSTLGAEKKVKVNAGIAERLRRSWTGERVDAEFVQGLASLPPELISQINMAERLTPLMTALPIGGNPRLIKRFMNSIAIRMAVAKRQGITFDERVLVKLLLFERLAPKELYDELASAINHSPDGKPSFLAPLEAAVRAAPAPAPATAAQTPSADTSDVDPTLDPAQAADPEQPAGSGADATSASTEDVPVLPSDAVLGGAWGETFVRTWLELSPPLADIDMRGPMYVSREHLPVVSNDPALSAAAHELLGALITYPRTAAESRDKLTLLAPTDLRLMLSKVLEVAAQEKAWGTPTIVYPLLELGRAAPQLGGTLAAFFTELPATSVQPGVVPLLKDEPWATVVFERWTADPDIVGPVKRAISAMVRR